MDQQQAPANQITVFYSYAHEDERLRQQLEKHLSLLRQQSIIAEWHDRQIVPGTDWAQEIDTHLATARLILLLISPDFLASDYCYGVELRRALERDTAGAARVIPILLRPVGDWEKAPFARLAVLPTNRKPIIKWPHRDDAWAEVAAGIRRAIEHMQVSASSSSPLVAESLRSGQTPNSPTRLLESSTSTPNLDGQAALKKQQESQQPADSQIREPLFPQQEATVQGDRAQQEKSGVEERKSPFPKKRFLWLTFSLVGFVSLLGLVLLVLSGSIQSLIGIPHPSPRSTQQPLSCPASTLSDPSPYPPIATVPMLGVDPQQTHFNAYEHWLSSKNIRSCLRRDWTAGSVSGTSSPMSANGNIYVGSTTGRIRILNGFGCGSDDCSSAWEWESGAPEAFVPVSTSPTIVGNQVFVSFRRRIYAYNASGCAARDCNYLWRSERASGELNTPVVDKGVVYVGSEDGYLFAYSAFGCGQGDCSPVWVSAPMRGKIWSPPAVENNMVFVTSADGYLYAYDTTGCRQNNSSSCPPVWTASSPSKAPTRTSPTVSNKIVYVSFEDGTVYGYDSSGCTPKNSQYQGKLICQPIWQTERIDGGIIYSSLAVANGFIYVGFHHDKRSNKGRLYAYRMPPTCQSPCPPSWESEPIGTLFAASALLVASDLVFVGSEDHHLYAYTTQGCGANHQLCPPLWDSGSLDDEIEASPLVANGRVYVSTARGTLYTFRLQGAPL